MTFSSYFTRPHVFQVDRQFTFTILVSAQPKDYVNSTIILAHQSSSLYSDTVPALEYVASIARLESAGLRTNYLLIAHWVFYSCVLLKKKKEKGYGLEIKI